MDHYMRRKIQNLIKIMSSNLVDKEEEIKLLLLTVLSGENIIFFGPPGTAKSELARRACAIIQGGEKSYFEYLLTKFTTPEELFGPLSIEELKKGILKRNTHKFLPTAQIAFLDEIFKANSAILNSLLTIINEKVYHNGSIGKEAVPIISVVGASNELPVGEEELVALYDRFLLRKHVTYVKSEHFSELISVSDVPFEISEEEKLTTQELNDIREQASQVVFPSKIESLLKKIKQEFESTFSENIDEALSDRRLLKMVKLMKISAAANGRQTIDRSDLILLQHCLWSNNENQESVMKIINDEVGLGG